MLDFYHLLSNGHNSDYGAGSSEVIAESILLTFNGLTLYELYMLSTLTMLPWKILQKPNNPLPVIIVFLVICENTSQLQSFQKKKISQSCKDEGTHQNAKPYSS